MSERRWRHCTKRWETSLVGQFAALAAASQPTTRQNKTTRKPRSIPPTIHYGCIVLDLREPRVYMMYALGIVMCILL